MGLRRLRAAPATIALMAAVALVAAVAACGHSVSSSSPSISQLPLVDGAAVVAQSKQCDQGASAFCAIEAVVVDRRFGSSGALVASEQQHLRKLGWSTMAGDNGDERAAESPTHKVRVTYATAAGDLIGLDLKWIKRPWVIWSTLDRAILDGVPAMSVMLETGAT